MTRITRRAVVPLAVGMAVAPAHLAAQGTPAAEGEAVALLRRYIETVYVNLDFAALAEFVSPDVPAQDPGDVDGLGALQQRMSDGFGYRRDATVTIEDICGDDATALARASFIWADYPGDLMVTVRVANGQITHVWQWSVVYS